MILIDNYDSFTYNIVQYLEELGVKPKIYENDKITVEKLKNFDFNSIIISPGAGNPDTAGISMNIIKPVHGKTSEIYFDEYCKLFKGINQGFKATRYHSLIVKDLPESLKITAKTKDKIIMGIEHKELPIYGVQFHPEAILTEYGHEILENFIKI